MCDCTKTFTEVLKDTQMKRLITKIDELRDTYLEEFNMAKTKWYTNPFKRFFGLSKDLPYELHSFYAFTREYHKEFSEVIYQYEELIKM